MTNVRLIALLAIALGGCSYRSPAGRQYSQADATDEVVQADVSTRGGNGRGVRHRMPSYRPAQQRVLMLVYHLYFLDASGARVMEGEAIEASNDEGAVENAWSRGWDGTVEVWQGIRRVARITPELPPAAA